MDFNKLETLLQEEKISGVRASWTNREIKNTVKSILQMDAYKGMNNRQILNVFLDKFKHYIRKHNLDRNNVREIAKMEIERLNK